LEKLYVGQNSRTVGAMFMGNTSKLDWGSERLYMTDSDNEYETKAQ